MSDMRIAGVVGVPSLASPASVAKPATGFGDVLRQALGQVNQLQQTADVATQEFSLGQTRDVAGTLIAIEKAKMGLQLALQVRNKLLEAYQEILRTPL